MRSMQDEGSEHFCCEATEELHILKSKRALVTEGQLAVG
jgi:hypothetical protein